MKVFATNATSAPVKGTLKARAAGVAVREGRDARAPPSRARSSCRRRTSRSSRSPSPRLWWPAQYGEPALHDLELELVVEGDTSDRASARFGIREITLGAPAERPRLQGERPQDPHPRRRLVLRPDAALLEGEVRAGDRLRQGHGPQHHQARGQARGRGLLRRHRPRGHPRHARLVLLRPLGAVEEVGRRGPARREGVAARPDPAAARARLRLHLAERQRRPAPGERRAGLPRHPEGARLPEPRRLLGHGDEDRRSRARAA